MKNSITCLPGNRQRYAILSLEEASKTQLLIADIISDGKYSGNRYIGVSHIKKNYIRENHFGDNLTNKRIRDNFSRNKKEVAK